MMWSVLGAAGFGYLVAGGEGAAVALIAVVVGIRHPRAVALAAVYLLVVAAVATVIEAPLDRTRIPTFGTDRDLAAAAGRLAGGVALAAVLSMARRERAFRPRGRSDTSARPDPAIPSRTTSGRSRARASSGLIGPWIVGAVVAIPALALSTVGDASSSWMTTPVLGLAGVLVLATWARRRYAMSEPSRH